MFLPHPRVKVSIVGSLRDRKVACSASDRQGSNFESCVWRKVSSQSSHRPQEVLLAQFSLYVHKGDLKPDSLHLVLEVNYLFHAGSAQNYLFQKYSSPFPPPPGIEWNRCNSYLIILSFGTKSTITNNQINQLRSTIQYYVIILK